MNSFVKDFKRIFWQFNGSLLPKEEVVNSELIEMHNKIYNLESYEEPINDKINLSSDIQNIGKDLRKAIKEADHKLRKRELVNG